jgi:ABC-2 type transport system permease protein
VTTVTTATIPTTPRARAALRPTPPPGARHLLRSERIKLLSTRSPWWAAALASAIAIGFGMLVAGSAEPGDNRLYFTLGGMQFAMAVVLVTAAIAVTNEYRFGSVRTTFQATPHRVRVLLTKAALVSSLAFVLGEVVAFATFFLARTVASDDALTLTTASDWRMVTGHGIVYGLGALIAVGIGSLVRQTAAAISVLLVWMLMVENLVGLIPRVGDDIARVMPFANGTLYAGDREVSGIWDPLPPSVSLAIFAGTAVLVLGVAALVVRRRDA